MAQLRDPSTGCPWDIRQDFKSLRPYLIEEAYEVIDAIDREDFHDLRSELGDLLLQVVFHSQLAKEEGLFDFEEVATAISEKLVTRHPHVFAGVEFENDEQRQRAWEESKEKERREKGVQSLESVLDGVAQSLPALVRCEKVQDRAAHHGFDWPEVSPVFEKVKEELDEVYQAWEEGCHAHTEEEVGDLLLVVVNLARHLKVNPELALKKATEKFTRRFHHIEKKVGESGRILIDCELAELDAFWNEAKEFEKNNLKTHAD